MRPKEEVDRFQKIQSLSSAGLFRDRFLPMIRLSLHSNDGTFFAFTAICGQGQAPGVCESIQLRNSYREVLVTLFINMCSFLVWPFIYNSNNLRGIIVITPLMIMLLGCMEFHTLSTDETTLPYVCTRYLIFLTFISQPSTVVM